MGFSLHQMHPRQRCLNRAIKSPIGSPELTPQHLGQGKIVSIVGSREAKCPTAHVGGSHCMFRTPSRSLNSGSPVTRVAVTC
jgi:hypothetical protein